jgi:hypothetical protein
MDMLLLAFAGPCRQGCAHLNTQQFRAINLLLGKFGSSFPRCPLCTDSLELQTFAGFEVGSSPTVLAFCGYER